MVGSLDPLPCTGFPRSGTHLLPVGSTAASRRGGPPLRPAASSARLARFQLTARSAFDVTVTSTSRRGAAASCPTACPCIGTAPRPLRNTPPPPPLLPRPLAAAGGSPAPCPEWGSGPTLRQPPGVPGLGWGVPRFPPPTTPRAHGGAAAACDRRHLTNMAGAPAAARRG